MLIGGSLFIPFFVEFGALTPLEPRLGKKLIEPLTNLINNTSAMSLLYECINTVIAGNDRFFRLRHFWDLFLYDQKSLGHFLKLAFPFRVFFRVFVAGFDQSQNFPPIPVLVLVLVLVLKSVSIPVPIPVPVLAFVLVTVPVYQCQY
jgi:hypothetical protein